MNQDIAKSNDARELGNIRRFDGVKTRQLVKCFVNDFELALNRRAQIIVSFVICKRFFDCKPRNPLGRLLRIPQQFSSVRMRKLSVARTRRGAGNTG